VAARADNPKRAALAALIAAAALALASCAHETLSGESSVFVDTIPARPALSAPFVVQGYTEGKDYEPVADPKLGAHPWKGEYDSWHEPVKIKTIPGTYYGSIAKTSENQPLRRAPDRSSHGRS